MEKYLLSMNLPSREQMTGIVNGCKPWKARSAEIKSMLSRCRPIRVTRRSVPRRGHRAQNVRPRRRRAK